MQKHSRRRPNWRSPSTPKTVAIQTQLRAILRCSPSGLTVSEIASELGISRQNALYHVKKAAATAQLLMVSDTCEESGGLRWKLWNEDRLGDWLTSDRQAWRAA